jgi:hypothetical protein
MFRLPLLLFPLAIAGFAAKPTDYSTDIVVLDGGRVVQTMKLYVSGQKSRLEGMTAGPLGRMVAVTRQDKGVSWALFPDKRQYSETPLSGSQPGKVDLANFDLIATNKEILGRETVLGYPCTKMRATVGKLPNGQPLVATAWVADALQVPLRLETMGIIQENRNLRLGPQPASLFEIPAGFTKTGTPGMPAGMTPPAGAGRPGARPGSTGSGDAVGRIAGNAEGTASSRVSGAGQSVGRAADRVEGAVSGRVSSARQAVGRAADRVEGAASGRVAGAAQSAANPAWKLNTNLAGGDYRVIDMATSDPTACKAACDNEAQCKSWTLVKPERPGGMGYCYLKSIVPEASAEACCISGLKGAAGAVGGQGGAQTSKYKLEMNVNRGGEDYRDFIPVRASADLCAEACAKESRCQAWTWVKNDVEPPTGHCWLKSPAPEPGQDECCVSGLKR